MLSLSTPQNAYFLVKLKPSTSTVALMIILTEFVDFDKQTNDEENE